MNKNTELDAHILYLVNNHSIQEQSDLQHHLERKGYQTPQATLSRKLKKLNIAKVAGKYKIVDYNQPNLPIILNAAVTDFGLILLHTQPASANNLAYYFDQKYVTNNQSAILGTIAGDDTVLLIVKNKSKIKHVIDLLEKDFPYIKIQR